MIVIIDYQMGNIGSIVNMLKRIGVKATISSSLTDIGDADKLILPGVGAFDHGMRQIQEGGLSEILHEKVMVRKTPILGICLGMQLFTERSEEGRLPGLGWIAGETVRFHFHEDSMRLKIPHMGWNTLRLCKEGPLFQDMDEDARFYFVHSYHVRCKSAEDVLAVARHGYDFPAAIQKGHIVGTQFHPEKSHRFGMKVLENFARQ